MPYSNTIPALNKAGKKVSVKRRGYVPKVYELSPADLIAATGQGNSKFEQQVDAIAKEMGIIFDAYQYWVPLLSFESTIIDFVLFHPKRVAVFADGPQHTLRKDTENDDIARRAELESQGWVVVAIAWNDFLINPQGEVGKILYA